MAPVIVLPITVTELEELSPPLSVLQNLLASPDLSLPITIKRYGREDYFLTIDTTKVGSTWQLQLQALGTSVLVHRIRFCQQRAVDPQRWWSFPEQRQSLPKALTSDWSLGENQFYYQGQPLRWVYRLEYLTVEAPRWPDSNEAVFLQAGEQWWREQWWQRLILIADDAEGGWWVQYFLLQPQSRRAYNLSLRPASAGFDCDYRRVWIEDDQLLGYRYHQEQGREELRTTLYDSGVRQEIDLDGYYYRHSQQNGVQVLCSSLKQQFAIQRLVTAVETNLGKY